MSTNDNPRLRGASPVGPPEAEEELTRFVIMDSQGRPVVFSEGLVWNEVSDPEDPPA